MNGIGDIVNVVMLFLLFCLQSSFNKKINIEKITSFYEGKEW